MASYAILVVTVSVLRVTHVITEECDNVVRLDDLRNLILEQKQLIEQQKATIDRFINTTGVYFNAKLNTDAKLDGGDVMEFNFVGEHPVGGFDLVTHKFTAPVTGSYLFTLTLMNSGDTSVALELMKTGAQEDVELCSASAIGGQYENGLCTRVVDLTQGEKVWAALPSDADNGREFRRGYTALTGVLIRAQV